MKAVVTLLPLAALAAGFAYPDEHVFAQLPLEDTDAFESFEGEAKSLWSKLPALDKLTGRLGRLKKPFKHLPESIGHPLDHALSKAEHELTHDDDKRRSPFDYSWIEDELQRIQEGGEEGQGEVEGEEDEEEEESAPSRFGWPRFPRRGKKHVPHRGGKKHLPHRHKPHFPHRKPHHGFPHRGPSRHKPHFPHRRPGWGRHGRRPHHRLPHKRPGWKWHHHPKHHKPNQTIYELISGSKFTKNLTALIDKNKDIVKLLNSTDANHTVFVPTDWAFKRIHKHLDKIPDEIVTKVLLYHILPDLYPSFKLLWTHTAPTALEGSKLGGHPQRVLSKWFGFLGGLRVNYFSRVIVPNIRATNGIIHATTKIILPPPPALTIITTLPGTFSTFELGLHKTGLYDALNTTGKDTVGGTLFAPTNFAFKKLGPAANAFLFSKFGEKYLKALLSYHVVPDRTLYSTAFYDGEKDSMQEFFTKDTPQKHHDWQTAIKGVKAHKTAKTAAYVHLDLPTLLDDRPIAIDIIRRGFFVTIKANAFVRVAVKDGLAKDGVVQVLNSVLIPPKKHGSSSAEEVAEWDGESEMNVADLKGRLEPYLAAQDLAEEEQEGVKLDL